MKNVLECVIIGFVLVGGYDYGEGEILGISKCGFLVDYIELVFVVNIDLYWCGQVIIVVVDGVVEVEEVWFQLFGIGYGIGLKGGCFCLGIGYFNEQYLYMWDFVDVLLMY